MANERTTLLSVDEVAAWLRVTEGAVNRAVRDGEFPPPLRIVGQRRWPVAVIEKHVERLSQRLDEPNQQSATEKS